MAKCKSYENKKAMKNSAEDDDELIAAASSAIKARFKPNWHVLGAAIRLGTGEIVTGVHLEANVGRIAVCAEAVALGRAVTEHGSSDIASVVAVYHSADGNLNVVAPCGMCREMISDYAPLARVLMPIDNKNHDRVLVSELLPRKYRRSDDEV